jgi:hypothetical protein
MKRSGQFVEAESKAFEIKEISLFGNIIVCLFLEIIGVLIVNL